MTARPLRAVHQFHPTVVYGDAVSNDCLELQRLLWSWDLRSELFARNVEPALRPFVREDRFLSRRRVDGELLLVHHSLGDDAVERLVDAPGRKALIYHNVTPAHYFRGLNERVERLSALGREQLERLARTCELGIGDSEFNRRELEQLGLAKTAVVPILVDWAQFEVEPDADVSRALAGGGTTLLCVAQVLPHKGIGELVLAFARYRQSDPTARLFLVGSTRMSGAYRERIETEACRLGLERAITCTGAVSVESLVAYYRGATAFVTLSEHEGFCVPLLEAMRFGLPIVAHAAAAIPETLGDAGLLVPDRRPETVAAALERVVRDGELRDQLVARGTRRLEAFAPERTGERLRDALSRIEARVSRRRTRSVAVLSVRGEPTAQSQARGLSEGLRAARDRVYSVEATSYEDLAFEITRLPRGVEVLVLETRLGAARHLRVLRALVGARRKGVMLVASLHGIDRRHEERVRELVTALLRPRSRLAQLPALLAAALPRAFPLARSWSALSILRVISSRVVVRPEHHATAQRVLPESVLEIVPYLAPVRRQLRPGERTRVRERLNLLPDAFAYVAPGRVRRCERLLDIQAAAPAGTAVVVTSDGAPDDRELAEELRALGVPLQAMDERSEHIDAGDCVVLYHESGCGDSFAVRALASGRPCVLPDLPELRQYEAGALFVADLPALERAMREMRDAATRERLRAGARVLRRMLSPDRNALRYLAGLGRR